MIEQSENRQAIESNGERFDLNRLLAVRNHTRVAITEIARQIVPGMAEEEAVRIARRTLKDMDMLKGWHGIHVRFGTNTLKQFGQTSDPGVVLGDSDIFFIDIGPVHEGYEGDGGDTFVVGNDPEMLAAKRDVHAVFDATRAAWLSSKLSGTELYAFAEAEALRLGWRLNLDMSGHRLSDFPHAVKFKGGLSEIGFSPAPALWVLEIQIAHPERPFSAFYEDLLLP